jgi:hypothetical protein
MLRRARLASSSLLLLWLLLGSWAPLLRYECANI